MNIDVDEIKTDDDTFKTYDLTIHTDYEEAGKLEIYNNWAGMDACSLTEQQARALHDWLGGWIGRRPVETTFVESPKELA